MIHNRIYLKVSHLLAVMLKLSSQIARVVEDGLRGVDDPYALM
jgi:hypothetical protein